ncbi:MAG: hypothetical protein K0S37_3755, partial [Microbacterium sp.]|nr:hypothetical protein [Microbacterium sp.]
NTVKNATAQVYALADTNLSTPLALTDLQGVPMPELRSSDLGIYPAFRVVNQTMQIVVVSGSLRTPMTSLSVYANAAEAAAAMASGNAGAAASSAQAAELARVNAVAALDAAVEAAEEAAAVGNTNDTITEGLIKAPASKTATALNAAIGGSVAAFVPDSASGAYPTFERLNGGAPIFTQANQHLLPGKAGADSIYWFRPINAEAFGITNPLDKYYWLYSTNHTIGGVYLATSPTLTGPFTGRGKVYDDDDGNGQCETPFAVRDSTGQYKAAVLYQIAQAVGSVGTQSTKVAFTDDFINWVEGTVVIDITPSTPGDGHTGYQIAHTVGSATYVQGLYGGGNMPAFAMHVSYDGCRTFQFVAPLGLERDLITDDRRAERNTGAIFTWRGQQWWVGLLTDYVSGSNVKNGRLAVAPISADLTTLLAPPRPVLYPVQGTETTNYQAVLGFTDIDGKFYLIYQCGNSAFLAGLEN